MTYFFKFILLFSIFSSILLASLTSKYEQEPNDLAVNATVMRGSKSLIGTLNKNEKDNFLWKVSTKDSKHAWDLVLMPLPNSSITIEVSKVIFQKAGLSTVSFSKKAKELKEKTKLFTFINDTRSKVRMLSQLLVEKGEYLITIQSEEKKKDLPYKLKLIKKNAFSHTYGDGSKKNAQKITFKKNENFYNSKKNAIWFKFEITKEDATKLWQIDTSSVVGSKETLNLFMDSRKVKELTLDMYGKGTLWDLELEEGIYYVQYQGKKESKYALSVQSVGLQNIDRNEIEPNNRWSEANSLRVNKILHANVSKKDKEDYYKFFLPKKFENKYFDISLASSSRDLSFRLYDENKHELQEKGVDANFTMESLQLKAEKYYFLAVEGLKEKTDYKIEFSLPKEENHNDEVEPNDAVVDAQLIDVNRTIKGKFLGEEEDCYLFNIRKSNYFWTLKVEGDSLERLYLYQNNKEVLRSAEKVNKTLIFSNLFLVRGEYSVCVTGKNETYELSVKGKNLKEMNLTFLSDFEKEPNQSSAQANLLEFNTTKYGVLERTKNIDMFYFTLKNREHIRLTTIAPKSAIISMNLQGVNASERTAYGHDANVSILTGVYPAGRYTLRLSTSKPSYDRYALKLERLNPFVAKKTDLKLDVNLSIDMEHKELATYNEEGQILSCKLKIQNNQEDTLNIESYISDNGWHISSDTKELTFDKSKEKSLEFLIKVPKNIDKDEIFITFKVSNKAGAYKTVSLRLKPKEDIHPKVTYKDWGIPKAFLGTLNVARLEIGAKRILEHNETKLGSVPQIGHNYHYLFDDIAYVGNGFSLTYGRTVVDENVTIKLLGEEAVEVVGVSLNPIGSGFRTQVLKNFTVSLSEDGKNYKKVYSGVLDNRNQEQFFTFDKSHKAKFAKLTLHDNHYGEKTKQIRLGEWKVLAKHSSLETVSSFNIANPKLGGHIVSSSKELSYWGKNILSKTDKSTYVTFKKDAETFSFILAFKNERMAKVKEMHWLEQETKYEKIGTHDIKIEVSTQTPLGPWHEVKKWKRSINTEKYNFEEETWARYIRFSIKVEKKGRYYLPSALEVYETKITEKYQSILAQWGENNHESSYEYQNEKNKSILPIIQTNGSKKVAYILEQNKSIRGEVSVVEGEEDWYKIEVPKGQNSLSLVFTNEQSVDVAYELYTKHNIKVEHSEIVKKPLHHDINFIVEEGTYYLKVKQPPISVIFAWDNSVSVAPYQTQIATSVNQYVTGIEEQIDAVNLLCFNKTPSRSLLLSDFSSKPEELQEVLNNFDWSCDGSGAEEALFIASHELEDREGIKGIIVIADADGGQHKDLWEKLEKVNPKIFSIRVASTYDSRVFHGIMQSWTRINNGTYSVVQNSTEMTKAIKHATHSLRQAVFYDLKMQTSYVRPLGDGSLKIISPKESIEKKKVDKSFAIELILDASGSMLKRINGKRRIEIAKDVLKKAVQEIIPPKTLVALRVFGHKKADSCRTDLEMRLQVLNVKKTTKLIDKIKAKNLAKTPIADSLAQVANDLKKVKGKRVIILVTDGKETCDGNATKEIKKLNALGIDVRLNIVGFAIDNDDLKKEFASWAKLGNGAYFEANDKSSLESAVKEALKIPYKVYDLDDKFVAQGIVGDESLKLKGGVYKVIVDSYPKQVFEDVLVEGEAETSLDLNEKNIKGKK